MNTSSALSGWWYLANGQSKGTVNDQELQHLLIGGALGPDSLVWKDGMQDWQAIREVDALASLLASLPTEQPQEITRDDTLDRLLEDARKRLVETGTRNRLIHVNRENKRANALNIINERSDDIFEILNVGGKRMRFLAIGKDHNANDNDEVPLLEEIVDDNVPFDESRYTDNKLETPLGPDALQKRLLRLARDARTAEEEQGINILFLALGFLTWFEDKNSDVKREAPLILLPVELVRSLRTSTYDLRCRDEDIVTNLPLQERLKRDFGIDLPEIDTDQEGWSPSGYFDRVNEAITSREGWRIDRDGMRLGFFSFAKLLMLRDLDPDAWGEGGLEASALIEGLLRSGFEAEPPLFGKEDRLDEILEPADIIQVVDADASQTKVIQEVRDGRTLVVQGPPGTGKSQTITNIIASAVHDGKSVLFVAEKMAALSVVHDRLKRKTGLESICLELHSRAANKKKVVGEIARTLAAGAAVPSMPAAPHRLKELRDKLNEIERTLHKRISGTDATPFTSIAIMSRLAGIGAPPPKLDQSELAALTKHELDEAIKGIAEYAQLKAKAGARDQHPFFGVGNLGLQPLDIQRLGDKIESAIKHLKFVADASNKLGNSLNLKSGSILLSENVLNVLDLIAAAPESANSCLRVVAAASNNARLATALDIGIEWSSSRQSAHDFVDVAWRAPVAHLRSAVANGVASFFARLGSAYRSAGRELETLLSEPLPKAASDRLELIDRLIALQEKRRRFHNEYSVLQQSLGDLWLDENTAFADLKEVADWYEQIAATSDDINLNGLEKLTASSGSFVRIAKVLRTHLANAKAALAKIEEILDISPLKAFSAQTSSEANFDTIMGRLAAVQENQGRYSEWCQCERGAARLSELGLGSLVSRIDSGEFESEAAQNELKYAYAEAVWKLARQEMSELDVIAEFNRHEIVEAFCESETSRMEDVQQLIRARHLGQLPSGGIGEMALIRGEIGKKRGHKPIRKLFELAGPMLQRIKPVLLMSPISVAQFLPPNSVKFDLLVIDEASQVRPEDALGAVARAKQLVVVGDQKQLPPTSFFDRLTGNESEDDEDEELLGGAARATEMESILSLCEARSIPSRMLEWHYRSRDPSLITVSNTEFYESNLVLPPSPLQNDENYGLRFIPVRGAYTSKSRGSGRPGTNKIEAQEIVNAVARHASEHPDLSLGIATFSATQRNMVTDLLELERRQNLRLDEFLREGKPEDVFVKNIENVQGDERDVILISVGYGPLEPGGRLQSMSFGPVNMDGGERRLNVLFSRARLRCDVFASFDPGAIDFSRTKKEGPRILKRYLQYAKTGQLEQSRPTGGLADSPFEEDVASIIRNLGYEVDPQVGSAGFMIDLGVKHPERSGQYMIAVECDGATYHSALWARERDRLRQEILENLGWCFHRIWSTDWFYRRDKEIERLSLALEKAAESTGSGADIRGANQGYKPTAENESEGDNGKDIPIAPMPPASFNADPYKTVRFNPNTTVEPHEASLSALAEVVKAIVDGEGPIHQEEVARRLAACFGKERAGRRILEKTVQALHKTKRTIINAESGATIKSEDEFWFTDLQEQNPRVRRRSDQSLTLQKAEMIPPLEIAAALKMVVKESGNATRDETIRAVAKVFGFDRVGSSLRHAIEKVIANALA